MPFEGNPMIEQLVDSNRDGSYPREPYWVVTHHPIFRPDGTRVPARTRALYCPATHRLVFGAEAAAATHTRRWLPALAVKCFTRPADRAARMDDRSCLCILCDRDAMRRGGTRLLWPPPSIAIAFSRAKRSCKPSGLLT
jgi:hypothetical protein